MPKYLVNTGLDYNGRRVEPGNIVDDLPARSVKWMLEQGIIEEATTTAPTPSEPKKSPNAIKGDK